MPTYTSQCTKRGRAAQVKRELGTPEAWCCQSCADAAAKESRDMSQRDRWCDRLDHPVTKEKPDESQQSDR